jgi:hypothetical protein
MSADDRQRRESQMNRKQLEQHRKFIEVQTRWALLYGGDQELLDLLRIESDRLSVMIEQRSRGNGLVALARLVRPRATTAARTMCERSQCQTAQFGWHGF